ncbi:hypothetical protein TWF481_006176 [Arthrobotrys musiformis]|uniref:Uncharacterized protein n=1 Tax=Arthrobotrys musiformis TaxID=47236 RepID=A0AAV9WFW8_9PEZI
MHITPPHYLFVAILFTFFSCSHSLLPVACNEASQPPEGPSSTTFTRNFDAYIEIISTTGVFQKLYKGTPADMNFLHFLLSAIYDPNTPGPTNTLRVVAPTDLYEFIVGLKLHCFQSASDLARTLVQIDEVEVEVPPPLPESASTADSNPLSMEEEQPNSVRQFQYLNDDIATDLIGRIGTLIYQYDQILPVAEQEWPAPQVETIKKFKAGYGVFRNGLNLVTRKLKYAGVSSDMRKRELTTEELRAMVADPGALY